MTTHPLRFAIFGALYAGVSFAQNDSLSGVGSNVNLFSSGPFTYDELALDPTSEDPTDLAIGELRLMPRLEVMAIREKNPLATSGVEQDEDNTYITISPGAMLKLGTPRGNYSYLDYTADFAFGDDVDDKTVSGQRATALAHYTTGLTTLDSYYRYRDISAADTNVGERLDKQEHAVYGNLEYRTSEKTALSGGATYSLHEFEGDAFVDFTELRLVGRVHYKASPKTRLYVDGARGDVDLDGTTSSFGDAEYTEAGVGASSRIAAQWNLDTRVGYQWRTFTVDDIEDLNSVVALVNLSGTLIEEVQAGIRFWSLVQPSVDEAGGTLSERRIEPNLSRHFLTDDLILSGTLVWGWSDYNTPDTQESLGEVGTRNVYDDRADTYFGYTLAADWQAATDLSLGLAYSRLENDSDTIDGIDSRDYDTERYMLRGRYNF